MKHNIFKRVAGSRQQAAIGYRLSAIGFLLLFSIFNSAEAQNGVNYSYTHSDGVHYSCSVYTDSIIITDATPGTVRAIVIPDSIPYGGVMRPVREIGAQAFAYSDIESVVIPNTVTTIVTVNTPLYF